MNPLLVPALHKIGKLVLHEIAWALAEKGVEIVCNKISNASKGNNANTALGGTTIEKDEIQRKDK